MIIGIAGRARSGKDTVAGFLVERHGYVRHAFADALKESARATFGFTDEQLYGDRKEAPDAYWSDVFGRPFTPREALQKLGTEGGRIVFGDRLWTAALRRRILDLPRVVVPDVRFRSEVEMIRRWGGRMIKVVRPGAVATGGVDGHASEHDLDECREWDVVIENLGTLDDLRGVVDLVIGRLA